ncbi:MAG: hypothetical protein ABSD70_02685 [Terracidiphilus sp.]|jgi:hypothetical protein
MESLIHFPKDGSFMPAIRSIRKLFLLRFFWPVRFNGVLLYGALFLGFAYPAHLAAQQTAADSSQTATAAEPVTADPPDLDSPSQANAAAQSSGTDAPSPQSPPAPGEQQDQTGQQTKRILGIIPNFRAVSADTKLPPETVKEKFVSATEDSFDYSSIFIPAVLAVYNMGTRATPEFHEGAAGYGRYFWHSAVDQTSENYMVEFVFPTFTREDSRYYTLGHGGFIKRTGYALSRAVITRSNSGDEVFNASEVFGGGASAGISNLYYPSASRSLGNTATEWGLDVAIDAASFWFREFWPDINRRLFHNKYAEPPAQK